MAASNPVVIRLVAAGQAAFEAAMKSASSSVLGVGEAADKSAGEVESSAKRGAKAGSTWRKSAVGLAKWAGGAAAIYGAKRAIEGAVHSTEDLAKSTMAIQRVTGMDAQAASQWAEITKVRGVNAQQFGRGLVTLSKQMHSANQGNQKTINSFTNLGVAMSDVQGGNTQAVIMQVSDALAKMPNAADRAATAQKLFGKAGQQLLPLLGKGSGAIQDQLNMAQKYGAVIGKGGVEHTKEFAAKQREMKIAMDGVKVSMGTALMPVILAVTQLFAQLTAALNPFLRNATLVKLVVAAIAYAFVALKVNALLAAAGFATLDAAILLIPAAIAAIAIGVVILYRKWGWFHRAVNNTFNWLKAHWPLLLAILTGPIGLGVLLIVRNFGKIKGAVGGAISWIKKIPGAVSSAMSAVGRAIGRLPGEFLRVGKAIVKALVNGLLNSPQIVLDALKSLLPGGKIGAKIAGFLGFHAAGGIVRTPLQVVGERGPELAALPYGTRITPLPRVAPAAAASAPSIGGVATTAHFYLDRRLVATAVARDTADRKARR